MGSSCVISAVDKTLRRAARDLGNPRLTIPARKLRAAFTTQAARLNVNDRILASYLGHAARDILGQSYRKIDPDELRLVSDALNGWRRDISRKHSGNIPESQIVND